jgi:hypothetical protein
MKKTKQTQWDRYSKMSKEELRKETDRFNGPVETVRMPAEVRARVKKFHGPRGRPKLGRAGVKQIGVTIEKRLLADFDRVAKRSRPVMKRSELLARAMREYITAQKV